MTLLTGVTGSGKTEVYLDAVAECLARGRQALVLLPEIALSAQWLERFQAPLRRGRRRCGIPRSPRAPGATPGGRWRRARRRSSSAPARALFLPFPELGLIVVDEEHETAFKQEEGVVYHARDMAVVRARLSGAACVLVSATPSLESLTNVEAGRYAALDLPERHGGATLPAVEVVDLRRTPPERGRFLAPPLVEAVTATIERRGSRRCCSSTGVAMRR